MLNKRKYNASRFNNQAGTHDQRTGIPEASCLEIAQAVVVMTRSGRGEVLLDLGAGTGLPGSWFPDVGFRYVGLDASQPMLDLFAARRVLRADSVELRLADIDDRWPVEDRSVGVVFSSRAAHLFDREHLVSETERVTKSTATFLLGRVVREESSMRQRLRDEMRARLKERGFRPTDAGTRHTRILESFQERGASSLVPVTAAKWLTRHSAAEVLSAWELTSGLGGCELSREDKWAILDELWVWAEKNLNSINEAFPTEERFVVEGVRLEAP